MVANYHFSISADVSLPRYTLCKMVSNGGGGSPYFHRLSGYNRGQLVVLQPEDRVAYTS